MRALVRFFIVLIIATAFFSYGSRVYAVGAITPFTSYEAEAGLLGGGSTIYYLTNPPTTEYSSPELEASGHAFVALTGTGQYVQWTNNTGGNIAAINLRSCIPDAPTGGGITNTLDLYVNGTFRQAFAVSSKQNYNYEGTNYNGQTDKNPADGDPRDFWNDTHALIAGAAIVAGSTIRFQQDSTNSASFYYIDVIDVENPPAPLSQPANSLSIISYGAVSNNPSVDNTAAINNCFSAALSQGKIAWIPAGTYYFSAYNGCLNASGITIAGAGPWYSTLDRVTPASDTSGAGNIITTTSCTLSNVSLDCNSWSRDGGNNNGAVNFAGTNWVVNNVWIQHVSSAFWCAGLGGIAENCRVLSVWSDGGNFNQYQSGNGIGSNLTYSNNFVRGTGDDAMAINATEGAGYTPMNNIRYVSNTSVDAYGGKGIAVYGGHNLTVTNNLITDSARYDGIEIGYFSQSASISNALVSGNVLMRCGGNGYNDMTAALEVGTQNTNIIDQGITTSGNIVSNSIYGGLMVDDSTNCTFTGNVITMWNQGTYGVTIWANAIGNGSFTGNSVDNLPGFIAYVNNSSSYTATLSGNSWGAAPQNLALHRVVTVSSVADGTLGTNAVDGNFNTRWGSAYSDPQWIYVDLGATNNINGVILYWETAYGKAFSIQVSSNATTWATVYSTTNGTGGTQIITFPAINARYVRMYGTARGTVYGYSLWEFQVYGTGGSTPSVINFDVPGGESGGVNYSGQGAYSDSGHNYWNPIVPGGTTAAGTNSDGATVSAVTFTEAQAGDYNDGGPGTQGSPSGLQSYFAYANNSSTQTCTLNNVPAGTYTLYLYGINGGSSDCNRGTVFTVSSDLTSAMTNATINTRAAYNTFIVGNDYVAFNNVTVGSGATITIKYTHNPAATGVSGNTEGDFNGLQLIESSPSIKINPTLVNAAIGGSAQLVATVSGVPPFYYQWQKGTNGVYVNSVNEGDISGSSTNVLSFNGITASDAADYRLVVTNVYGAATSQVAVVNVTLSPSIVVQPTSEIVGFGNSFQLAATAIGEPPLDYQWQKENNGVFIDTTDTSSVSGSMTNVLSFNAANTSDAGNYQLIVTNAYGAATSQVVAVTVSFKTPVGSSAPWTEDEAESGTPGGGATVVTLVPPLSNPSNGTAVLEASGAAYVTLTNTSQSISWVNNSGQSVTALNLRYAIPDAPSGYGITNTLDLYVNGTFRQAIPVNSKQIYVYGANPTDKNPADGGAFILWDEYHFFITGSAVAPGDTITLQKDPANTASFYNIDLIDLEAPPAPMSQPTNSLSITSYGAVSNSPATDNTTAIQDCINAAQSSGKSVWIPAGEFFFGSSSHNGLSATSVTIGGAGLWYSELYNNPVTPGSGGPFFNNLVSCTLQNLDLDCNANDADSPGAMDVSGTNWVVNSVWASHLGVGFWGAGNNGIVENMRVNNTWGDGININNFTDVSSTGSNITISNNFIRFVDNDGIAVNGTDSSGHTPMSGITIVNNTIDEAAGRLVVYGGNNIVIEGNYCHDLVQNDGIQVGYEQQTASITNVLVEGNEVLRCGNPDYGGVPGMLLGSQNTTFVNNGTNENYYDGGYTVIGNLISDSYYGGLQMQICSNVDFADNVISAPGLYGIQVASFATGNAQINNNVVSSLNPGQPMFFNSSSTYPVGTTNSLVRAPIEAVSYNNLSSASAYCEICSEGGEDLCSIYNGDYAVYSNLDLNGINSFAARVASVNAGDIEIHMDNPTGTLIGDCAVAGTGGVQTWYTVNCNVSGVGGYHNVYLVFTGNIGDLFSLEWFALLGNAGQIEAASDSNGSEIQTENCVEGGLDVTNISSDSYAVYNQLNLTGATSFDARVASGGSGGSIQVRLDSTNGTLIGTCAVSPTGGWQTWNTVTCTLNGSASGYHNVYLVFTGGSGTLFNLEWLQFQFNSLTGVPSDLALDRPVTASSVDGPYPATDAVDGNLNTRWSSDYSDPQWIYVDLGTNYNITAVTLAWETAYGQAYQIQVSTNAIAWTAIYSESNGTGGTENLTGLSGFGRYVRMYGTVRGTQYGYSLWEFEVFGDVAQSSTTTSPPPPLSIQPASSSQGLTLQWPDNGARELPSQPNLYYAPDLIMPVVWTLMTNTPIYSNGQWSLTASATNNQGFYRLLQP
jgi:hypothetical protein